MQSIEWLTKVYDESKFWMFFGGGLWTAFKTFQWFKTIKTNDLHHIQLGLNDLGSKMDEQTEAIVTELRELRNDTRMVTQALLNKN